ncbi:MAG: AAA domain-containing protein [Porticoccaceae bacterium]
MNSPRDLLKGLLGYIEEQAKEIDPKGYHISAAKGFVRRNTDLAGLPGLEFDLRPEGDHIWLHLARLEAHRPPIIPDLFKGLFKVSNDPFGAPPALDEDHLVTWIAQHESKPDLLLAITHDAESRQEQQRQKAQAALQEYLPQWKAWAEGERPRRMSISLYGDLFALKHQIEAEETAKPQELIWGIGVASWQIPFGENTVSFEYPLLTQAVELFIDERSMALEIRPRATDTRVEMEAFVACSVLGAADVEHAIKEQLQRHKDCPVTPFDASSYTDVLKLAASNLDGNGSYRELLTRGDPVPTPGTDLIVTDAWVLLSRLRTTHYLTDDLKRLKDKLATGCDIPLGPLALVTPPSDKPVEFEAIRFRGLSSRGSSHGKVEELYFPLPYNEEQVTIIQRLEKAAGVAVQGPPGTGKTHTIANVICHYLATGRRVLVTSRGEPALEVLQSKIPEEVRALTVALMASDREGIRQFQASIETIQYQVSQLNPEQTRHAIATLESAIDRAHHELASIDTRIDEIAIAQLSEVEVDGVPMRAQKLAQLVTSGLEQYGWFDDDITLSPENAPPLTEDEAGKLREARRKVGQDLVYIQANFPSADSLPTTSAIAELHEVLSSMRTIEAEIERGDLLDLKATTAEVLIAARDLLELVEEAKTLAEELESTDSGWPLDLRMKCGLSSFISERQALESLFSDIDALIEARAEFLKRPVEFPDAGLNTVKTREAVARAVETGKPFGFIALGAGDAKEHIAAVKVSGLSPASIDDWAHVQRHIELHEKVVSFVSRWNQFADELSIPRLEGGVSALRRIEMVATIAKKAHRLATEFDNTLPKKADAVFCSAPAKALMGGSAELNEVKSQLLRHLTKAELSKAATQLSTLQEKLAGKSGPVSIALKQFIETQLGNPGIPSDRVSAHYAELTAELRRIASLTVDLTRIKDSAVRIEQAGAPKLASRVRSQLVEMSGEDVVFPVTWRQAWNWARMRTYLDSIEARNELLALSARRRDLEGGLSRLYKDLVSKAAWLETKRNATPKVLQALAGYATAIHRIRQGTGPNATRYRRDAREAMLDAAGAVPCWIMSHARISEAMPPDIGAFDLVIVDEASQSDLWALPAILRGKKILVVGDDKQVSPDGSFISGQKIQALKTRFLSEQPYGTEMTPEKSLYDLAARVFAAEQVMLREHFRCVPPIIAYANRVFYEGGIQPLRIPKASERIDPPLVDIHVTDGLRDKHDRNDYEAQAIAEEISAILKNEAFVGRTMGVVSLLGMEQAKHIDSIVRQRCDAAELLHRKFECGDARTFQGSERDIMFLSMVADNKNCHALSGLKFDQRFNVAASRARDRMYLVRSVKTSDLSDKDLRLTLLGHFNKPMVTDNEEAEVLIDQCQSGFEREVFSILASRGYRVIPQVKTGAYRIDMVVEGSGDNRLAIELDGDEYHGPDRWQHDMNRQRVLERAGWVFWRCFASTWALRKDDVLQELLTRLTAMGIEPMGAIEHAPSLVEKRTWKFTPVEDNGQVVDGTQAALELAISSVK